MHRRLRPVMGMLSLVALAAASLPAAAGAAAPAVLQQSWAWANNRNPAATHVPAAADRGNLLGAGAASITHVGPGVYTVQFPGAAIAGVKGVAHVSPLGLANRVCVITSYGPVAADVEVDITCSRPGGPFDSPFTVTYLALSGGTSPVGMLYASHPGPNPYVPAAGDYYNSTGGPVQVRIMGVGVYRIRIAGLGTTDGDIQVTAATPGQPRFCEVGGWNNNAGTLRAIVRCYRPNGVLANSRFTLSFNKNVGLKGDAGANVAYALANLPGAAAAYVPAAATRYNSSGANITVQRFGVGRYRVTFKVQPLTGTAVVTPYGAAGNRCFIKALGGGASPVATVGCVNGAGGAANTQFLVSWLN